jgi:hypothetical protein
VSSALPPPPQAAMARQDKAQTPVARCRSEGVDWIMEKDAVSEGGGTLSETGSEDMTKI